MLLFYCPQNVLPLPPRTTKPKLVDKPRHVRRYPLKLIEEPKPVTVPQQRPLNIYQNTKTHSKDTTKPDECKSEDVVDTAKDTNPFISTPGTSGANPFGCYLDNEHDDDETELDLHVESDTDSEEETHTKLAKGTILLFLTLPLVTPHCVSIESKSMSYGRQSLDIEVSLLPYTTHHFAFLVTTENSRISINEAFLYHNTYYFLYYLLCYVVIKSSAI